MHSISQASHWKNFRSLALFVVALSFVLRTVFLIWSGGSSSIVSMLEAYAVGFLFDVAALVYVAIPWLLLGLAFPPSRRSESLEVRYRRSAFILTVVLVVFYIFISISEITFWNEFHSRFNFIAVDYLVYTSEVLKNIWESYPIGWLILGALLSSLGLGVWFSRFFQTSIVTGLDSKKRMSVLAAAVVVLSANYFLFPSDISKGLESYSLHEVSKNGLHSLFSAYLHNELDYDHFYKTMNINDAFEKVRQDLQQDGKLVSDKLSIGREIQSATRFRKLNVVMVSMESMSARFMNSFGSKQNITPNLDRFASEGLFFSNVFSTGTRTVRGLEALSLSVPPTPGQSIVRRPKNEGLYNIGDYFNDAGYATEFLYGGHGYFDNMNAFFAANSFSIWDQGSIKKSEITFSNAWGVCDEDLFALSVRRADEAYQNSKPFFQLIMTTSNHRPYTYPENKIDIPSGTGRDGAVKYSDFSIGEFIKSAEKKPWFKNTIFIFVADHDAAVAGNIDVPVADFRIPFIIYAPGLVKPEKVTKLASQIDVAPTILGLLDASYVSHFFGRDIRTAKTERAFLGTYQKVGLLKDGVLTLLGPNKTAEQFVVGLNDEQTPLLTLRENLIQDAVSYYQVASSLFRGGGMIDTGDDQIKNQ